MNAVLLAVRDFTICAERGRRPEDMPGFVRAIRDFTIVPSWVALPVLMYSADPVDEPGYMRALRESVETLANSTAIAEEFVLYFNGSDDDDSDKSV